MLLLAIYVKTNCIGVKAKCQIIKNKSVVYDYNNFLDITSSRK